jgi:hypothetical protein
MPDWSPDQLEALKDASPGELEFLVTFARSYVNGRWVLCWGYRAIVAVGIIAGALTGILALFGQLRHPFSP